MAAKLPSQMISASAPWRRNTEELHSKTLSVEAPEFVPSWKAPEFVPSWKREVATTTPASEGNCYMISLGAYSDDESDEEVPPKSSFAALEAATESKSSGTSETFRFRRPWRVNAAEFVPRGALPTPEIESSGPVERRSSEISSTKLPPWRRDAPILAEVSLASSPEKMAEATPMSQSTTASSFSGSHASETASSASCASRSRSPTPPPAEEKADKVEPLSISSLLLWRHASSSERPEAVVTSAQKHESVVVDAPRAVAETVSPKKESTVEEKSWRNVAPVKKLEVSEESWVAQQRQRRASMEDADLLSNEEVVRVMKSILNKLTIEKFESLSNQLIHCGIRNATQLELLIQEVFEKATTQHHFIDMYADLCSLLHSHFAVHPVIDDPKMNFKKILLNCCQVSFERHLKPPENLATMNREERNIAERMYKMRMIGNIRFVGALLVRKMLASKVALAIMEELLQDPTPEALESLAALLTSIGASFDHPDWAYRTTLNAIFKQVEKLSKKSSTDSRVRCLLKDVLDLRNSGWQDMRPKKIEGPKKLEEVAMEESGCNKKATSDGWAVVAGSRLAKPISPVKQPSFVAQPKVEKVPEKTTKGTGAGKAMLDFLKNREEPKQKEAAPFDRDACRSEVTGTLAELRLSHDVAEAISRIGAIAVPVTQQPAELCDLLAKIFEEGSQDVRKVGFQLVVGLFKEKQWKAESLAKGVRSFVEDVCPDLKCDVPNLSQILRQELHPSLQPFVFAGVLQADQHQSILAEF